MATWNSTTGLWEKDTTFANHIANNQTSLNSPAQWINLYGGDTIDDTLLFANQLWTYQNGQWKATHSTSQYTASTYPV